MPTKYCPACDNVLDLDAFHRDARGTLGRQAKCIECKKLTRVKRPATKKDKARYAKWAKEHPEQLAAHRKKWRTSKRGRAVMRNIKHQRRTLAKAGDITPEWLEELRNTTTGCPLCGVLLTDSDTRLPTHKHLDHIVPICVGGGHTKDNVRYTCSACNLSRPKDGRDVKSE